MNGRESINGQLKPCKSLADVIAVVSGSARLEILKSLVMASCDVSHLARDLELDISLISHNLSILKNNGLVDCQRLKQRKVYHLTQRVQGSPNGRFIHLSILLPTGESAVFEVLKSH